MRWVLQLTLCVSTFAGPCFAQNGDDQGEQQNAPESEETSRPRKWAGLAKGKLGSLAIRGLFDGYYSYDSNHPYSGRNTLRNFDIGADRFDVNMADLSIEMAPRPFGFRVEGGFGRAFDAIHASSNSEPALFRHIWQSYVSFEPKQLHGFRADFGKFLTSVGAEPTDTMVNWNYSRSWLFTNGPYFHFGLRTSMPVGKHFTGGVQVLQGWNNIVDNNSGKTWGFTGNVTSAKVSWLNTYLVGPEKTLTTEGYRHFYDTVVSFTPANKFAAYLNFDYGVERNGSAGSQKFLGIAGAAHFQAAKRLAFSPRLEWYNDVDGFITGRRQQLKEITTTAEYAWFQNIRTRLEFRHDWSNQPYFETGTPSVFTQHQDTVALALLICFPCEY